MRWLVLMLALFTTPLMAAQTPSRFAVYYTDQLTAQSFEPYDLLIFDKNAHPDLRPLHARGKTVLAYLSLAEAAEYRPYTPLLRAKGLLLSKVSHDAFAIDVRNSAWSAYIVETLLPDILARGFDGVMLDTADTALALEAKDKKYVGMNDGLVRTIRTIRLHYPDIKIMINRGFAVLPEVTSDIDMVLAESIFSTVNAKGEFMLQPTAHYESVSAMLTNLTPRPAIYTLDYWPEDDKEGIRTIYRTQREKAFIPYVASPDLQHIVPEP